MRTLGIAALLVLSLLTCSTPVVAGGWAMVRLDTTPGEVVVGVPWKFGFMVRQHDVSPTNDVEPVITAQHQETGDVVTATAQQEGRDRTFRRRADLPSRRPMEMGDPPRALRRNGLRGPDR